MKNKVLGGTALAAATVSLALAGAMPAQAKGKHHHAAKPSAEKHNCGGKNGCPGMSKSDDKQAEPAKAEPAKPDAAKTDAAKPAESKPADGK